MRAQSANSIRLTNSRQRPPIGTARNNGKVQRAARRLLGLKDVVSTAELAHWVYGWQMMHQRRQIRPTEYAWARHTLAQIAQRVGRGGGRGRPILWILTKVD